MNISKLDQMSQGIIQKTNEVPYSEIERLSHEEQNHLIDSLVNHMKKSPPETRSHVLRCLIEMTPNLEPDKLFYRLSQIISLLNIKMPIQGINQKTVISSEIIEKLQPLELISLAYELSEHMKGSGLLINDTSFWGLINILPHLHPLNQKEFAYDVFMLTTNPDKQALVLDGLTSLLFQTDHDGKMNLTMFFAEMLNKEDQPHTRYFIIDLLTNMTPALPEVERVLIADHVAPFIYFEDLQLVKKSIDYFASVICLLPAHERFSYAEMIAGLSNNNSVRNEIINAIKKAVPFLESHHEKTTMLDLLSQLENETTELDTETSGEPAYYEKDS